MLLQCCVSNRKYIYMYKKKNVRNWKERIEILDEKKKRKQKRKSKRKEGQKNELNKKNTTSPFGRCLLSCFRG